MNRLEAEMIVHERHRQEGRNFEKEHSMDECVARLKGESMSGYSRRSGLSRIQSDYNYCPECGAVTIEPDGIEFTNLRCSVCNWIIPITIKQGAT